VEKASSPIQTLLGALTGLAGAALLGWILFSSTRKLSVRGFFKVTNILLIMFAAGMVAVGVHEFNEAGIIPALIDPVWNINAILSDNSQLGLLLKALFGYDGNPTLSELLAYVAYLSGVGVYIYVLAHRQKPVTPAVGAAG